VFFIAAGSIPSFHLFFYLSRFQSRWKILKSRLHSEIIPEALVELSTTRSNPTERRVEPGCSFSGTAAEAG
jgi:hypothetical protein